jgi:hypothetical protein
LSLSECIGPRRSWSGQLVLKKHLQQPSIWMTR